MGSRDPRIDAYIETSAPFAQPILRHLREVVHEACPQVEEAMKWSFPHFLHHGMLASMASFKEHCAFGFWKGELVMQNAGEHAREAMGHFGRIASVDDLPPRDVLTGYVRQAMTLNETGVKAPSRTRSGERKPELEVPGDVAEALGRNAAAQATFDGFSPSARREYVEWITEAKSDATRQKRLAQAVEWMAEGKTRHWKYARSA